MLATVALERLRFGLADALASMDISGGKFGFPEYVKQQAAESEKLFQGYSQGERNREDAYAAARALVRGQTLNAWQRDLAASALAEPIRELSGVVALGCKHFPALLASYEVEAQNGELWRLTWHGLLSSYFSFDPSASVSDAAKAGWQQLRLFLERSWPVIDRGTGSSQVPDWVAVLRSESQVLTDKPADKYARSYLMGDTGPVERIAADLGIPPSSWFWHALVLGVVRQATATTDAEFRQRIPRLLQLIHDKPVFRDEAVELILVRYHACKGASQDERLRDFVVQPSVWKNPKLKSAGIATAWNRVPEPVWRMVLGWVNERNLKDFFDILAARNKADEGRLAFWSKYMKQIDWTRLVFSADTMALKSSNAGVRDLIAREEGSYARFTGKQDVDAFMMQIGSFLIIEFSKKPNACYVYEATSLPFEPYSHHYDGGTEDLAAGYREGCAARIVHTPGWQPRADDKLRTIGIRPDAPASQPHATAASSSRSAGASSSRGTQTASTTAGSGRGGPDMLLVRGLVSRFPGARIDDRRSTNGGRLWVNDDLQNAQLAAGLKAFGFRWANKSQAWYFPES
ncbi:EH signature domain-containing protein [Cupriavidus sp. 2MCAB6]|uniref:EH signature domain-containing protein n=1 Tax=Cupriavidus sp. 2MCAB6 TaxID=3232981 RepID=UPI003F90F78F